jgi:hypothetical protein
MTSKGDTMAFLRTSVGQTIRIESVTALSESPQGGAGVRTATFRDGFLSIGALPAKADLDPAEWAFGAANDEGTGAVWIRLKEIMCVSVIPGQRANLIVSAASRPGYPSAHAHLIGDEGARVAQLLGIDVG